MKGEGERLTASVDGFHGRKGIHDEGETGPEEEDDVGEEPDGAEPEGAVRDVVAAADEQADDGDGVGDVEEDDTGCYHAGGRKRC